jgi:hypothetical protein
MNNCFECFTEFEPKSVKNTFCSAKCRRRNNFLKYYQKNKEKLFEKTYAWYKKNRASKRSTRPSPPNSKEYQKKYYTEIRKPKRQAEALVKKQNKSLPT